MDWAQIKITPDFKNKTVHWEIPSLDSTNNPSFQVRGSLLTMDTDLDRSKIIPASALVVVNQQPTSWVGTLNDSQSFPVFVLGFRIVSSNEELHGITAPWAK
jgi:hypothetical protein